MEYDIQTQQALRSFHFLPDHTIDDLGDWLEDEDDDVLDQAKSLGFVLEQTDDTIRERALEYTGENTLESVKNLIDARRHAIFNLDGAATGSPASKANGTFQDFLQDTFDPDPIDIDVDVQYDALVDEIETAYDDELGLLNTLHQQQFDEPFDPTKLTGISSLKQWDYQGRDPDEVHEQFDPGLLEDEIREKAQAYTEQQIESFKTEQMERLYEDITGEQKQPTLEEYKLLKAYQTNAITLNQDIPDALGTLGEKHENAQDTLELLLEQGDAIYEHEENEAWLDEHGLDPGDVRYGIGTQTYTLEDGTITVETAAPTDMVHMGDAFNSCFSINQSGPTKLPPYMADANKLAVYARNENDAIIGRLSIAVTDDETMIVPNYYAHGDHDPTEIRMAMDEYGQDLADAWEMDYAGRTNRGTDDVEDLVAGYWEPT